MPRDTDNHNPESHPAADGGKVIDLQGHQAAEQTLDDLLATDRRSPAYRRLASTAAASGPPILGAIIRRLDASRPQSLATLGRLVASYPARAEAIKALARAAGDRRGSDSRRMGAALVLAQYLAVAPPEDFLSTLRSPASAIAAALVGTLDECSTEAELLHDFIYPLIAQPAEVLYAVMNVLAETPGDRVVPALRLLALQPEPEIMHGAIDGLAARGTKTALQSLAALEPNLPTDAARTVSRLLHKVRLSGHGAALFLDPGSACRALLSAIDGSGRRMLWIQVPLAGGRPDAAPLTLAVVTGDTAGITSAAAIPSGSAHRFPAPAPVGTLHPSFVQRSPEAAPLAYLSLLEVPYGYGLTVLRDAAAANWDLGVPLPVLYQLYVQPVWRYGSALDDDEALLHGLSFTGAKPAAFEADSGLLSDELFESWYLDSGAIYLAAQELLSQNIGLPEEVTDESWRALLPVVIKLARSEFGLETRHRYSARLNQMAEWLWIAGRRDDARVARAAAQTMLSSPPEANLLALALVQKGILMAVESILSREGNGI